MTDGRRLPARQLISSKKKHGTSSLRVRTSRWGGRLKLQQADRQTDRQMNSKNSGVRKRDTWSSGVCHAIDKLRTLCHKMNFKRRPFMRKENEGF